MTDNIRKFKITLTTRDPIHLGGFDEPLGGIDNPVALIGDRMCIPGPSLKGAYRNELERYLNERYGGDESWEQFKPCLPSTQPSESEKALRDRYRMEQCAVQQKKGSDKPICPVCYLLGANGLSGFVTIPFLFAPKDKQPEVLYASRIDRVSGTVLSGNRSYQATAPGTSFEGRMEVCMKNNVGHEFGKPRKLYEGYIPDEWLQTSPFRERSADELLKELILERLEAIRMIGGFRSKGFGGVTIHVSEQK